MTKLPGGGGGGGGGGEGSGRGRGSGEGKGEGSGGSEGARVLRFGTNFAIYTCVCVLCVCVCVRVRVRVRVCVCSGSAGADSAPPLVHDRTALSAACGLRLGVRAALSCRVDPVRVKRGALARMPTNGRAPSLRESCFRRGLTDGGRGARPDGAAACNVQQTDGAPIGARVPMASRRPRSTRGKRSWRGCTNKRCRALIRHARVHPPLCPPGSCSLCRALPHLHRDRAHFCHICTGTGLISATSASGLGSSLPHQRNLLFYQTHSPSPRTCAAQQGL
jgi:hypothetical protein